MPGDAKLTDYLHYYKPLKAFLRGAPAGDALGIGKEKFKREIANTGQIVRQIDRALRSLDVTQRQIIKETYINEILQNKVHDNKKKTQRQIIKETYINDQDPAGVVEKLGYSSRHYRRLKAQALKKMENEFTNAVKRGL